MYTPAFFPVLLFWRHAHAKALTEAKAIVPTTSGQIGINPVSIRLGSSPQYVAPIGTDTGILQQVGSTTKVRLPLH
jgi:hypothetical protein